MNELQALSWPITCGLVLILGTLALGAPLALAGWLVVGTIRGLKKLVTTVDRMNKPIRNTKGV